MTQYSTLNVKLSNSQLHKLKSAIKIRAGVSLNLLPNLVRSSRMMKLIFQIKYC